MGVFFSPFFLLNTFFYVCALVCTVTVRLSLHSRKSLPSAMGLQNRCPSNGRRTPNCGACRGVVEDSQHQARIAVRTVPCSWTSALYAQNGDRKAVPTHDAHRRWSQRSR